jgi:DNA-binding NarL/FixJ family response regulator
MTQLLNRVAIVAYSAALDLALAQLATIGITTTPVAEDVEGVRVFETAGQKVSYGVAREAIRAAGLDEREVEILRLTADGVPQKAIGTRLGYPHGTIKDIAIRLYRKLGAVDRTNAVLIAYRLGILGGES